MLTLDPESAVPSFISVLSFYTEIKVWSTIHSVDHISLLVPDEKIRSISITSYFVLHLFERKMGFGFGGIVGSPLMNGNFPRQCLDKRLMVIETGP